MNRIPFFRFAAVALLLVASGRQARADFMYALSVSPLNGVYTPNNAQAGSSGSVALTLATPPTTPTPGSSTGTTVDVATIAVTSGNTSSTNPDTYNVNYNLTLTLKDQASLQSAPFQFSGNITGTASTKGASLVNTFSNPLTDTAVLGGHTYAVTIQPTTMSWSGLAPATSQKITAVITVDGQGTTPPVSQTPEPSALLLAGLAVPALGFLRRRKATRTAVLV